MDPTRTQNLILLTVGILFLAVATVLLPSVHRPIAGVGLVVFPVMLVLGKRLKTRPDGYEVGAVSLINAFAFLILVAKDAPGSRWLSFATACVGALTATGLWVVNRFKSSRPSSHRLLSRVLDSIGVGALGALGLSLLAAIPLGIALLSDPSARSDLLKFAGLVIGGYFAAGLSVGLLVGLVMPISSWPLGRLLLGFIGGVAFYGAVSPATALLDRLKGESPIDPSVLLGIAILLGLIVGPSVAFGWND